MKRKSFIASIACAIVGFFAPRKAEAITIDPELPTREEWQEFLKFVRSLGVIGESPSEAGMKRGGSYALHYIRQHIKYLETEIVQEKIGKAEFKYLWNCEQETAQYLRRKNHEFEELACQPCKVQMRANTIRI